MLTHLIYGSKDFALILRDFLEYHAWPCEGFIDDYATGPGIVGTFEQVRLAFHPEECRIVLGIGYNNLEARWQVYEKIREAGFTLATLIHRRAYVRNPANVGEGSIVMANATIDCNAVIEEASVLWPGAVVNHDSRVGRNTFLSPSSTICGFVNIGAHSFVGAGAVVVDHVDVPSRSFIKANVLYKGDESSCSQSMRGKDIQ